MAESKTTSAAEISKDRFELNDKQLLIVTLGFALFYWFFSTKSPGFYQQDEANHFVSMMRFWENPNGVLSNWAKPGYKVLFAIPALGGQQSVLITNCLVAAFSGWFAYKSAALMKLKYPVLALIFLLTQPFWINLSFRNYSELISAFLLVAGFYNHLKGRYWLAGLLTAYIVTMRQEFYPLAVAYGVFFLVKKEWIAAAAMAIPPLLHNLWGYYASGDILYLYTQITGNTEGLADLYPRQGFDHYLKTSIVIFGATSVALFVVYCGATYFNKSKAEWLLLIPVLGYLLINCLINWQEYRIGPSTGGNLRYMLFISPLLAILCAKAIDEFDAMTNKFKILIVVVPLLIIVAAYMNYQHNYIVLTEERDNKPFLGVLVSLALLFIPVKGMFRTGIFSALVVLLAVVNVKGMKLSEEDQACKDLAVWFKQNEAQFKGKQMFVEHAMFYYYTGKIEADFNPRPKYCSDTALQKAEKGSLVIWDSHYSYKPKKRPEAVNYDYFTSKPDQWELIKQEITADQTFGLLLFVKK